MKAFLFFIFSCIILLPIASAQEDTEPIGSLEVTGTSISYNLPGKDTTVSRDLLASLPGPGEYQWVADDLALLVYDMELRGEEFNPPPLNDSLRIVVDSLAFMVTQVLADRSALQDSVDILRAQVVNLEGEVARIDELEQLVDYAFTRIKEVISQLE